jgi:hypothetical protein
LVGLVVEPVESARQAAKPASPRRLTRRFGAAGHHHVGIAQRDQPRRRRRSRARPVEQAVTTQWFGPFRPNSIDT